MNRIAHHFAWASVAAAALSTALVTKAAAPVGRYTIANGTVYDNKTKLTWQQQSASQITLSAAPTYCSSLGLDGDTWRLPTMKELITIVDYSIAPNGPAIDSAAFPGTP